jgi:YVTN family beta-propeller protein
VSVVDPRVGLVLAGYRIERLLGRGGMSSVYLAEHLRLHRKVALKLMAPELADDDRFRERFLRESQLAASLDHPNVVPVYDADESGGVLYIAMRYVEGTDLRELLRRSSPLPPARAVAIVGQAAAGLDAAHRRGLVHRDVKPGNILIGEDDHVYVSDFGLTKQASSQSGLTATGQLVGTVDYVAPEQIQGEPVDGRADVYALACVLYETLVGAKPFEKDTEVATIWAHIQDPPPAPSAARPELPKGVDDVIARGMAKQPDERYATCRELVEAARRELGVSSGEIPRPPSAAATRFDWRLIAGAAAAVVIAAAVVAVLLTRGGSGISKLPPNAVGAIDPKTNKLVASVPVGKNPAAITSGFGSIWVANEDDSTVTRIDAKTRKATDVIGGITGTPVDIAAGSGSVWVTTLEGQLFRINPELNSISLVPLHFHGRLPGGMSASLLNVAGAARGSVWLLWVGGSEILRYDLNSQKLVTVEDDHSPTDAVVGPRAVWIAEVSTVSRLDATTNVITGSTDVGAITMLCCSSSVAVGEGSVWVSKNEAGKVWRVDPATTTALGSTSTGPNTSQIAAGEGGVWLTRPNAGSVVRLDPHGGSLVKSIKVGHGVTAITTGSGLVWVSTVQPGHAHIGGF